MSSMIDYWAGTTKVRTTKSYSDGLMKHSTKIPTHKKNLLYGMQVFYVHVEHCDVLCHGVLLHVLSPPC